MASLPPRQSQRRVSPPQRTDTNQQAQLRRDDSQAPSTTSIDSQTLFLGDAQPTQPTPEQKSSQESVPESQPAAQLAEDEPRKCWICFSDETEDGPETSTWRTPCPCALTAHESCLLDWIADMEAPSSSRTAAAPRDIRCPQCKSEIFLSRPRNRFVEAVGSLERASGVLLWPGVLIGLSYTILIGCSHHGAHTVRMIFGADDAEAILAPIHEASVVERELMRYVPTLAAPFFRGWRGTRVELGLPLIPMVLVASRTTFAQPALPVLPILFLATHPQARELANGPYWPPNAALTLTALPYLRAIYDECMERVWGEHERRWIKEVQPQLGREERDAQDPNNGHAHDDEDVVEVELGFEIGGAGDGQEAGVVPPPQVPRRQAPPLNHPPADAENGAGRDAQPGNDDAREDGRRNDDPLREIQALVDEQQQANQNLEHHLEHHQHQHQHQHQHENNFLISGTRIADTVLGALFFPTISAVMGEGLRFMLPVSWTMSEYARHGFGMKRSPPTGLLQTKWGRSIVGGCLFVVLKDAVRIYCRWRMAQAFRQRRVLNWDKKRGKVMVD